MFPAQLLLLLLVNGLLPIDGQPSGDDAVDNVQRRLMKLELVMAKLQLENGAIKEELNKVKKSKISKDLAALKQLEANLTLLQDSIQDINAANNRKLSLLQDELLASRSESSELRALVSLLQNNIAAQFVGTKRNMTVMQQSIKQLLENTSFLMDGSSMDADKLAELIQLVSTLQSLTVTLESRHLQFESLSTANNSWLSKRIDEVDQKLDTNTKQLVKKNRKQDKQLMKMVVDITDLKQQVDELSVNDTVVIATGRIIYACS